MAPRPDPLEFLTQQPFASRLLMAENKNVAGDSYGNVGSAVAVQIRHRRKQGVRGGSKPPLGLKRSVAVSEKHRTVTGESVRS